MTNNTEDPQAKFSKLADDAEPQLAESPALRLIHETQGLQLHYVGVLKNDLVELHAENIHMKTQVAELLNRISKLQLQMTMLTQALRGQVPMTGVPKE